MGFWVSSLTYIIQCELMCCYLIEQVETIFGRRVDHSSKEEGRALLVKPTHMGPIIFLLYFGMISSIGLSVVTFYSKALRLVAVITILISTDIMTVHTNGNCLPLQGRILDAFVSKFGTLKHSIPQVLSSAIDISRLVPMRTNFSRQVGSSFIAVALY
jgi:amino acid permease